MIINYKVKWQEAKTNNDALVAEITELRWENESLKLENKKMNTLKDRMFEAGCIIARSVEDLKTENLKLKIRLDVLSKKGVSKDAVQN